MKTIDELANVIRTVDGKNTMGAGELAEKIANHFALVPLGDVPPGLSDALKGYYMDAGFIEKFGIERRVCIEQSAQLLAKATEGKI